MNCGGCNEHILNGDEEAAPLEIEPHAPVLLTNCVSDREGSSRRNDRYPAFARIGSVALYTPAITSACEIALIANPSGVNV